MSLTDDELKIPDASLGIIECPICGFEFKSKTMVYNVYGVLVCVKCFDKE